MKSILKKLLTILIITSLTTLYSLPLSADVIPLQKLQEVEEILFAESSNDAIIERIDNLENILFGHKMKGTLVNRSREIINYVLAEDAEIPLLLLLNAMEWTLTNRITQTPIIERVEQLEKLLFATVNDGALVDRIENLRSLLIPRDSLNVNEIELNSGQELNIRLLDGISTSENKAGDVINFELDKNLRINNYLVIPAGTRGSLELTEVKSAASFGRDASLNIRINDIIAIDGRKVPLTLIADDEDSHSTEIAVGVGILSTIIISNPIGLVAGYFYRGRDIELAADTVMQLQLREDMIIRGLNF